MATCDKECCTNIAPVGTAVLLDENTLFVIKGPMQKTYYNLKQNPKAVFMVLNNDPVSWLRFFFTGKFKSPYGFRIYASFKEERNVDNDCRKLVFDRFGVFGKLKGAKKINKTLEKVLIFKIEDIRKISPFEA